MINNTNVDLDKLKLFAKTSKEKNFKLPFKKETFSDMRERLDQVIQKTKVSYDNVSTLLVKMERAIERLENEGDYISKSAFSEAFIGSKIGYLSYIFDTNDTIIGNASIPTTGSSVKATAENLDGEKIGLAFEVKFYDAKDSNKSEKIKAYIIRTEYLFLDISSAQNFLINKGKDLIEGIDYKRNKTSEILEELNLNKIDSDEIMNTPESVKKWATPLFIDNKLSKKLLSIRENNFKTDKETKFYAFDSKTALVIPQKVSNTFLAINIKNKVYPAFFNVDFELDKLKNTQEKDLVCNKLLSRVDKIVLASNKKEDKIKVEIYNLKSFISNIIDKTMQKKNLLINYKPIIKLNILLEPDLGTDSKTIKVQIDTSSNIVQIFKDKSVDSISNFETNNNILLSFNLESFFDCENDIKIEKYSIKLDTQEPLFLLGNNKVNFSNFILELHRKENSIEDIFLIFEEITKKEILAFNSFFEIPQNYLNEIENIEKTNFILSLEKDIISKYIQPKYNSSDDSNKLFSFENENQESVLLNFSSYRIEGLSK